MPQSLTVTLPSETITALHDAAREAGLAADEVVDRALREYLVLQRFRSLRGRLTPKAQSAGILTDQDVFDRIS